MTVRYSTVLLKPYGIYNCTVNFLSYRLRLEFNFNSKVNKRFVSVWLGNICLLSPSILSENKSYKLNFNAKLAGLNAELRFSEITEDVSLFTDNLLYFIEVDDSVQILKQVYDIPTFETNDNNSLPDVDCTGSVNMSTIYPEYNPNYTERVFGYVLDVNGKSEIFNYYGGLSQKDWCELNFNELDSELFENNIFKNTSDKFLRIRHKYLPSNQDEYVYTTFSDNPSAKFINGYNVFCLSPAPTYTLKASTESVAEGNNVVFTLTTTNVEQGKIINWDITGIDSADITPDNLTGNFTIGTDGKASKTINIVSDNLTEGVETIKFNLTDIPNNFITVKINDTSLTPQPTYNLTSNKTTVDEGDTVTFTLTTTNVAQGTEVDWLILPIPSVGMDSADITPSAMNGSFIVGADGKSTYTINVVADEATEGTEILQFMLTDFPEKSVSITINDTSVTINEERYVEYSTPATYDVVVKPNETIEVVLLGGSGSGGNHYDSTEHLPLSFYSESESTKLFNVDDTLIASANRGYHGVGALEGTPQIDQDNGGLGGDTAIVASISDGEITPISSVDGQKGNGTRSNHTGGLAGGLTDRQGGEGYSDGYGFGGGGGGAGYIKFKYKNTSQLSTQTFKLLVGTGGAIIVSESGQEYRTAVGSDGFASVHWNKP